jgi:DNA-binding XRE family transcriptional regulator
VLNGRRSRGASAKPALKTPIIIPTIVRGTIIAPRRSIVLVANRKDQVGKLRRHIQPLAGPERAFGDALREIRKEHGVSQEQVALDSGLDRTYVSLVERGVQSPTIRSVFKLATVLGVKPSELIVRTELLMSKSRPTRLKTSKIEGKL